MPSRGDDFTQSFLFYRPRWYPRVEVGTAWIWKDSVVRLVGNFDIIEETETMPYLRVGVAYQDTFSDKAATFGAVGHHFHLGEARLDAHVGAVDRPNETHIHLLSGARLVLPGGPFFGFQHTGHDVNVYFGWHLAPFSVSVWGNENRKMGVAVSVAR